MSTLPGPYKIRYVELDPHLIFNECGPHSAGPRGWDPATVKKRDEAAERWLVAMNKKNNFYTLLEASILEEGFRNPVLATAGWARGHKLKNLPEEMSKDLKKMLYCGSNGGSRLWVAQKHNLTVPCVVSDFINMFPDGKLIKNEDELLVYYKDKPKKISINMYGVSVTQIPQVHLKEE